MTKNREDRSDRLTEWAKQVLAGLDPQESGPVFTYRGQAIKCVKNNIQQSTHTDKVGRFPLSRPEAYVRLTSRTTGRSFVRDHAPDGAQELPDGAALCAPGARLPRAGNRDAQRLWHSFGTVGLNAISKNGYKSLKKMVHPARFELTTSAFGGQRSIQLSYGC